MTESHCVPAPLVALVLVLLMYILLYARSTMSWKIRSRGLPLPPGPPALPLIGNLLVMPRIKPWLGYRDLCAKYGEMVYMHVLGTPILVLGSARLTDELLNKRSANTSDRPPNPIIKLSGQDLNIGSLRYGQWWRRHRRAFWQQFHPGTIQQYLAAQRIGAYMFLGSLLSSPSQIKNGLQYSMQGSILRIIYGADIQCERDQRLAICDAALEVVRLATPGFFGVELFPFLRHLPTWFPGAASQKLFARSKVANDRLKHVLFDEVRECLDRGELRPSVAAQLLLRMAPSDKVSSALALEEVDIAKNVCAVAVEASTDTTGFTVEAFCLAMALYPDVQRRAQAELDAVVGPGRLPDHADADELVYINALIKEILRWHVVLPVGVAHRTLQDDELDGYFIPTGTTVIPNVWGILHDPDVYDDPFTFRPERFIKDGKPDPSVRDPTDLIFGFGRRICPGRYLALPSLFINIASLLHVFDISLPLDEGGQPIPIKHELGHGLLSRPEDSRCTVKPRSAEVEALILDAGRMATMDDSEL